MTTPEAHIAFKIEADKNAVNIGISGCPSFLPEEIDYWLNTALLSKISTKFTGNNPLRTPYEFSAKRVADLEGLTKTDRGIALQSETISNRLYMNNFKSSIAYGNDIQEKRMFFIGGVLHFGNGKMSNVRLINHDQSMRFIETYNNKPWIEEPVLVQEDNRLIVFVDRDLMPGPYTFDLTYLAYPKRVNNGDLTSGMDEIPEYMQYEVIKLAADMALENVESQRAQTHPQYLNMSE